MVCADFGIISGRQMPEYECSFIYNSSHASSGWFHSPNFPGAYPRYICIHKQIHTIQDKYTTHTSHTLYYILLQYVL